MYINDMIGENGKLYSQAEFERKYNIKTIFIYNFKQ